MSIQKIRSQPEGCFNPFWRVLNILGGQHQQIICDLVLSVLLTRNRSCLTGKTGDLLEKMPQIFKNLGDAPWNSQHCITLN